MLGLSAWPLELSLSTREQKPPSHLLTIILELARLGTSELGWCVAVLSGVSRYTQSHNFRPHVQRSSSQRTLWPSTNGKRSATTVIVNVTPADDEQTVRVPKTGEQVKRRAQAG